MLVVLPIGDYTHAMAISFRILPDRGLVYVRYLGVIDTAEASVGYAAFARDSTAQFVHKQLVDFAGVTGWDGDYAALMALQARKVRVFFRPDSEVIFVYHAPTPATQKIAQFILRAWDVVPNVIPLIQETEAGALAVLGQPETSFAEMLEAI